MVCPPFYRGVIKKSMDVPDKARTMRRLKIVLGLFLIGLVAVQLYKLYWPKATVVLKDTSLQVVVADNPYRHQKGLGGRKTLAPYDGMLFVFAVPGRYSFVMRDTLFSIDIVWFLNGEVVDIAPRVPTELGAQESELRRYIPRKTANLVLELPAGWAEKHNLKIGDRLAITE